MFTSGYYVTAEIRVKDPSRVDEATAHGTLPHTRASGALGLVERVQAIRTNVLEG